MTLEAYADTIIPGEKRWPEDDAIAGIVDGPGAVTSGAIPLLEMDEGGMAPSLDDVVMGLNMHAERFAEENGLEAATSLPPFVALSGADRVRLVQELTAPDHPEHDLWGGLALFCYMAFDAAGHLHTIEALEAGHGGLVHKGFSKPGEDGLWRFSGYSYHRPLARAFAGTTADGSPA